MGTPKFVSQNLMAFECLITWPHNSRTCNQIHTSPGYQRGGLMAHTPRPLRYFFSINAQRNYFSIMVSAYPKIHHFEEKKNISILSNRSHCDLSLKKKLEKG